MSSLFGLTKDQKDFLAQKRAEAIKEQPKWAQLEKKLLALGGESIAYRYEEDLSRLLRRGLQFPGHGALLKLGRVSSCHANTAALHEKIGIRIVTGWALSRDGIWRQHTWGLTDEGRVVETTQRRVTYFGFILTPEESEDFCFDNY